MNDIPKKLQPIFKKLKKSPSQLAEHCISQAESSLAANGYKDARLWAKNVISMALNELPYVNDEDDIATWLTDLDGIEHDVVEAIYNTFSLLSEELHEVPIEDIRDVLHYSLSSTLDEEEKEKYKGLYG